MYTIKKLIVELTDSPEKTIHFNGSHIFLYLFHVCFIIPWFHVKYNIRLGNDSRFLGFLCLICCNSKETTLIKTKKNSFHFQRANNARDTMSLSTERIGYGIGTLANKRVLTYYCTQKSVWSSYYWISLTKRSLFTLLPLSYEFMKILLK